MPVKNFYEQKPKLGSSHGGVGEVLGRSVFEKNELDTKLRFIHYTEILPGSSIGYHEHGNNEEVYIVLKGIGRLTVNGNIKDVKPGDVLLNKPYWSHGLENTGDENLCILVFEVEG
jgi:Mannose-6-phosphate isomerase